MYHISLLYLIIVLIIFKNKKSKTSLLLMLIPFVLTSFLRFGVGPDYFSYEFIYNNLDVSSFGSFIDSFPTIEIGFKTLFYIGRLSGLSFHITAGILSSLCTLIVFYTIWKFENVNLFAIVLYYSMFFITWNLSGIRQGIVIYASTFILFGSTLKLSDKTKYLSVLGLALFHMSAVILIPIYFLSGRKWTRKELLIFTGSCILISIIPFSLIFTFIKDIPFIGKVYNYIPSGDYNLFDFASLIRYMIYIFIITNYDKLKASSANVYRMTNYTLISLSIYFLFKQSELIASRLSIYGFFLCIFLFPIILDNISLPKINMKVKQIAILLGVTAVSFLYITKDLSAMVGHSGYTGTLKTLSFETIFDSNRESFHNLYNPYLLMNEICTTNSNINAEYVYAEPKEGDTYIPVYFSKEDKYGIINQNGEVIEKPTHTQKPEIHGDIVILKSQGSSIRRNQFRRVGSETFDESNAIIEEVANNYKQELYASSRWFDIHAVDIHSNDFDIINKFGSPEDIEYMMTYSFGTPFKYKILEAKVFDVYLFFMLDEAGNLTNENPYYDLTPYNKYGIATGRNSCGVDYINSNGDVIWTEKSK